ncbi:MAG: hypothetical protein HQL84_11535 [Magnetococcales bacterium]|nr:hypothetical protein [Magnetococcales bacterium]MBF0150666.1 hypothetical protein [Magnetococcales bacterium]
MARLKRVLLVTGRYLRENPYRELRIKRLLESHGVEVALAIPGRDVNRAGFMSDARNDSVLLQDGACWIGGEWDFRVALRGCQGVLLSSWRSYDWMTAMARHAGLPTVGFTATSGQDHWPNDVDLCLVRSGMASRLLAYFDRTNQLIGYVPPSRTTIVGSMLHETDEPLGPSMDRESFCLRYGMDPSRKIVTLFPAGVHPYRVKLAAWHSDWSQSRIDAFIQRMVGDYLEICKAILHAGCNLLIKLHPAAYANYWCQQGEEVDLWHRHVDARILVPEDARLMFHHMDIGVGINTNSSMDTGYFTKPFIYVKPDSFDFIVPLVDVREMEACCGIPLGPSSHWHTRPEVSPTPWMTSWLGHFCRVDQLSELLSDPETFRLDPAHVQIYVEEFWYRNDNRTGERIVEAALAHFEAALAHPDLAVRWRRLRHFIEPGSFLHWVRKHMRYQGS